MNFKIFSDDELTSKLEHMKSNYIDFGVIPEDTIVLVDMDNLMFSENPRCLQDLLLCLGDSCYQVVLAGNIDTHNRLAGLYMDEWVALTDYDYVITSSERDAADLVLLFKYHELYLQYGDTKHYIFISGDGIFKTLKTVHTQLYGSQTIEILTLKELAGFKDAIVRESLQHRRWIELQAECIRREMTLEQVEPAVEAVLTIDDSAGEDNTGESEAPEEAIAEPVGEEPPETKLEETKSAKEKKKSAKEKKPKKPAAAKLKKDSKPAAKTKPRKEMLPTTLIPDVPPELQGYARVTQAILANRQPNPIK